LIPLIRESDTSLAEPLSKQELRIITKIALRFPTDQSIYLASHCEPAWKDRQDGELIPYSDAEYTRGV